MGEEGWQGAEGIPSREQTNMKPQRFERGQNQRGLTVDEDMGHTRELPLVFTGAMSSIVQDLH